MARVVAGWVIAAAVLGQARILPAPSGLPFQLDGKTMVMDRAGS